MDSGEQIFCCLGINYRTSPVAAREQFVVPQRFLTDVLGRLSRIPGMDGCVLLSTCNRTEIYFESRQPKTVADNILSIIAGDSAEIYRNNFYTHADEDALLHLALVASGLDSMVIGETEIFGQIKDAYRAARACNTASSSLHRIFQRSFSIAKKVRSNIPLTIGPPSVGAAAVYLAQQVLGDLSGSSVLVVGAGEVARSTAQSLVSRGAKSIFVANRSYDRAVDLAERVGGSVIRFSEWIPYLENIDIVIVSTAAPVYVVSAPVIRQACSVRRGKKLFLIDLSVPRNIDPAVSAIDGVVLYDIDALHNMTETALQNRRNVVQQAETLITAWIAEEGPKLLRRHATDFCSQNSERKGLLVPSWNQKIRAEQKKAQFLSTEANRTESIRQLYHQQATFFP